MQTTFAGAIAASLMLYSAVSTADCQRPRPGFDVPDGTSTTEQDLVSVQPQLAKFADEVRDYLRCLNGEASQRAIGKDEAGRAELARTYQASYQEAATELKGMADCYAAQLRNFKDSGGGQQRRAADCSTFIAAAQFAGRGRGPATELVVEASGRTVELPAGSWLYYLVRDDAPRRCSSSDPDAQCVYRAVHVRNDSNEVLECSAELTYEGADSEGRATVTSRRLVSERGTYVIVESFARQGVNAQTFDAQCTPRAKLPPLDTPAQCKYEVVQPVAVGDYYPQAARDAVEEGPVVVEFTASPKAARPTDVRAVASSLYPSLDEAAVRAVSDMVVRSSCGKARYRLKLNFQLE